MTTRRVVSLVVSTLLLVACGSDGDATVEPADTSGGSDDLTADDDTAATSGDVADPTDDDPTADDSEPIDGAEPSAGGDQALVDALLADLDDGDGGTSLDAYDMECVAVGTVEALGGADGAASDFGITADNVAEINELSFPPDVAQDLARAFTGCGDLTGFLQAFFSGDGLTDDDVECITDGLTEDDFEEWLSANYAGDEERIAASDELFMGRMFANFEACGVEI